ncbi:potassium channel family protein [Streptomyces odontomachi]|uniref:potassium channel family protein n=1 Tax=Streptomyces odontomachi TaxID=2944940 RepID=UPI0027E2C4A1|nr:potassium channel family protein [Streptomyces sp. ODS25]
MTARPTGGAGEPGPGGGSGQGPGPRTGSGPGPQGRARPPGSATGSARSYALTLLFLAGVVTAYCLLPLDRFGPHHPAAGWTVFVTLLGVVAVLLLWQIRDVLTDRRALRPGLVIPLLVCLSVFLFAAAYYSLSKQPGEVRNLHTRLDAVYFTLVSLATIGYGDIAPIGQSARIVAIVQILYSFVFLTAATTALGRYLQRWMRERGEG